MIFLPFVKMYDLQKWSGRGVSGWDLYFEYPCQALYEAIVRLSPQTKKRLFSDANSGKKALSGTFGRRGGCV